MQHRVAGLHRATVLHRVQVLHRAAASHRATVRHRVVVPNRGAPLHRARVLHGAPVLQSPRVPHISPGQTGDRSTINKMARSYWRGRAFPGMYRTSMGDLHIDDFLLLCVSPFGAGMPYPGECLGFNLAYKKCSPQNYKRGCGLGGSKVGWVGPKLGGWVLSEIPSPPSYNRSLITTAHSKVRFTKGTISPVP